MKKYIMKADKAFRKLISLERILGAILLLIMLVICFMAVIMRYVVNSPWTWSEEIILVLLVIFGYICISIDVYRDEHVALSVLYDRLPAKVQWALDLFRHIIIGVFFALMVGYGWQIYLVKASKYMAASRWSQGIVFLAQTIAAALAVLYCVMNVVKVLAHIPTRELQSADITPTNEGGEQ